MIQVIMPQLENTRARHFLRHLGRVMLATVLLLSVLVVRTLSAAAFASEVMGATFKLFHPNSTGTCFLVRREAPDPAIYLITAAHSFERMKGNSATLVLRVSGQ